MFSETYSSHSSTGRPQWQGRLETFDGVASLTNVSIPFTMLVCIYSESWGKTMQVLKLSRGFTFQWSYNSPTCKKQIICVLKWLDPLSHTGTKYQTADIQKKNKKTYSSTDETGINATQLVKLSETHATQPVKQSVTPTITIALKITNMNMGKKLHEHAEETMCGTSYKNKNYKEIPNNIHLIF